MTIQALYPDISPSLSLDFANVKQLDPRVTFARASTARYYDGKTVAKAEENLLIRSEDFTTSWSSGNSTKTADTDTAPDGTQTADTITENTNNTFRRLDQNLSTSGVVTISVFAKLGVGSRFLVIGVSNSIFNSGTATFDLSTGTNTQTQANGTYSNASATIVAAPEGFYRCSLTITTDVTVIASIGFTDTGTPSTTNRGFGTNYTGDGTSSIILWGAQLEQRSTVTAYTATTTQPITNYIPVLLSAADNEARFDHNPTTSESLGLLIEEQRTNLFERSEEFDNAYWTKTNTTITANTIVAPDGTLTGDKLVENTVNGGHIISRAFSVSSGTTYTYSLNVKLAERTNCYMLFGSSGFGTNVRWDFDLTAGTATSVTAGTADAASITPTGNGWYRIRMTAQATATASPTIQFGLKTTVVSYTGDGFSGIFIWGAQLEAGAFPTSYIPTVASQVTRSADAASMTGTNFSSWYRADEGSFFAEYKVDFVAPATSGQLVIRVSDGTLSNYIDMAKRANVDTSTRVVIQTSGANVTFSNVGVFTNNVNKLANSFKVNDFSATLNSGALVKVSAGNPPLNLSQINIGNTFDGSPSLNGYIRKLAFYPKRLTDTQLQALTT
jgi:cyclophilin family peptidyl-prolyl cis-trans isomerase